MNNLPNAPLLLCLSGIFVNPLTFRWTSSQFTANRFPIYGSGLMMASFLQHPTDCTMYTVLQDVWPFQACALEASPRKQNMLKWVLIHPGRHTTHRELLRNPWENVWQTHLEPLPDCVSSHTWNEPYVRGIQGQCDFWDFESQHAHIYWTFPSSSWPNHRPVW